MSRRLWLRASVGIQFLLVAIPALDIVGIPILRAAHVHRIAACRASDSIHAGIQTRTPGSSHDPQRCILCQLCSPTALAAELGGSALPAAAATHERAATTISRSGLPGWLPWFARGPPQTAA